MFTAREHLRRLFESAEKIEMQVPYQLETILELLENLITKNQLSMGTIYMQITRGAAPRNHAFPTVETDPVFIAYTREVARPVGNMKTGVKAILTEDIRWLKCDIKSLNLLGNLLAKQKAVKAGCFEAIQHRGNQVTEGSVSNVSIVKDGVVKTHPADHLILNGITRQKVLEICARNDISSVETVFTVEDLRNADEVFLSGTTVELMPIIEIDGEKVGDGVPGPVTIKLQKLFEEEIARQCGELAVNVTL